MKSLILRSVAAIAFGSSIAIIGLAFSGQATAQVVIDPEPSPTPIYTCPGSTPTNGQCSGTCDPGHPKCQVNQAQTSSCICV